MDHTMIEQETFFTDHFTSDVGKFTSTFTATGCELRYPTGSRTFRTRQQAHGAIAERSTGFAAWDELPEADVQRQAFDMSRWKRESLTHTRCDQGEQSPIDTSKYPSVPPTSPPHPLPTET
jgi:hypothetical protein